MSSHANLTAKELTTALRCIAAWRADPDNPLACPRCGKDGVTMIDRSARPHAEWYVLNCTSCGLDATINIPLGGAVPGSSDG